MKPKKLIRIDETAWTWLKAESAKSRRSATQELAVILEGERTRRDVEDMIGVAKPMPQTMEVKG